MKTQVSLFSNFERQTPLASLNPVVKLLVSLLFMIAATLVFDARVLLIWIAMATAGLLLGGRLSPPRILRALLPFILFGFGYLWATIVFPRVAPGEVATIWHLGSFRLYSSQFRFGLTMALRALCFGVYSLLFVATTSPTDFTLSLMRQLRLSPRVAFSVLAAYRFLPLMERELTTIRAAHKLRGLGTSKGILGLVERARRYTVPLFASIVRKAGRVAMAMEARGLGAQKRSFYREMRIRGRDALYAILALVVVVLTMIFASSLGWAVLWRGQVSL